MLLYVVDDAEAMGRLAADLVAKQMARTSPFVLGLPTGSTPIPFYRELVRRHKEGLLDFSGVITFNLDEYGGLAPDDPHSFTAYMHTHLFDHVNIRPENVHVPNGAAADLDGEAERYEAAIDAAGGIDCLVLGIGQNGHIGFNEPGSSLGSLTRTKYLRGETRKAAAAAFGGEEHVPREVITMGCGTILKAHRILLLAGGAKKAEIVKRALEGPVTTMVPASILQLHRFVTAVVTRDCARLLTIEPAPLVPFR
jgi:glucosamine-6-phosphate deaminase